MPSFRKRPVVVEARRWDGTNFDDLYAWGLSNSSVLEAQIVWWSDGSDPELLAIETLEGTMCATVGDWIIRGVKGELYPCKPDIFEATYEPVDDDAKGAK